MHFTAYLFSQRNLFDAIGSGFHQLRCRRKQIVCGLAVGAVSHLVPDMPYVVSILRVLHIVSALSTLTQSSPMATAYDMWEEKEFEKEV